MILNYLNISDHTNINVHDAEIRNINIDYFNHGIRIPLVENLRGGSTSKSNLEFRDVIYNEIYMIEPWGEGFYIAGISVEKINIKEFVSYEYYHKLKELDSSKEYILIKILLNSGDLITIVAKELEYIQEI